MFGLQMPLNAGFRERFWRGLSLPELLPPSGRADRERQQ
jgi:hypothetical protein